MIILYRNCQKPKTDKDNRITTYVYDGLGRLVSEEEKLVGQTLFKAEYAVGIWKSQDPSAITENMIRREHFLPIRRLYGK